MATVPNMRAERTTHPVRSPSRGPIARPTHTYWAPQFASQAFSRRKELAITSMGIMVIRTAIAPPRADAAISAANVTVTVAAGAEDAMEMTVVCSRLTAFWARPCCPGSVAGTGGAVSALIGGPPPAR